MGDVWHLDEVFVKIRGKLHYLWRAHGQAQRFLAVHGQVTNLFIVGRHHLSAKNYRFFRDRAFGTWKEIVGVR